MGAVVPFLPDEPTLPTKDRVRRNDCRQLHHGLAAQSLALDGQYAPLVIGKQNPFPAHLVQERLDLGVLELDDLLLLSVDPAGEDEEEELPGLEDEIHWTPLYHGHGGHPV